MISHQLRSSCMRFARLQTGTKILGSFCIVIFVIAVITMVALWRMHTSDAITADLVRNKLAKQQLTADLLGLARLNGLRVVSIARSDSLEVADYFQAQLTQGDKAAATIEARLAALPATGGERELLQAAKARKATFNTARHDIIRMKDSGQIQAVEELVNNGLEKSLVAYTAALEALLDHEARQAHQLAGQSANASGFTRLLLIGLGVAALVIGSLLAWLLTRSIVGPLQQAVSLAELVARGDLRPVIGHARGDEIGRLFDALNRMTNGVSATVTRVLDGAMEIDRASAGIAESNLDLSHRTERQAAALKQTAAAMQKLAGAIEQNNVSAHTANDLAQSASGVAIEGAQAVEQVVARMAAIKASADRIVDITGVIDGIAFQTNLRTRAALHRRRARDQEAHRRIGRRDRRRHRHRQRRGQHHAPDPRARAAGHDDPVGDRCGQRRAGQRHRPGGPRDRRHGSGDPAECSDGRAGRRCRRQHAQPGQRPDPAGGDVQGQGRRAASIMPCRSSDPSRGRRARRTVLRSPPAPAANPLAGHRHARSRLTAGSACR
jgi:methyl-accepting chemotaxis protein